MGALCCRPEPVDFEGEVNLFHFHLLRSIGKGAFGKVRVVQHKQSKVLYALKYINKAKCSKMKAVGNIVQERRLLEEIDHSFVVNMRYAFQDDENCFFVLDLMLGGDLRFHLDRLGTLPEHAVILIVAEIALAISYLHEKRIVQRDLKPDNILLDDKGHAHITDLNIAVHFNERRPLHGVAGSMAYMAPEVLTKKGYLWSIDYWSLGVCAYELVFGRRPYRGRTNSDLTAAITREPLRFPETSQEKCSQQGIKAIASLLDRDVTRRLGCSRHGGFDELKEHPWFASIDWNTLHLKEVNPPFVPDNKKANFDATHELEELLLEDNPLKARKRNPKLDVDNLSAEYRQLEDQFTIYDFDRMKRRSYYPQNQQIASSITATSSNLRGDTTPFASRPQTPSQAPDNVSRPELVSRPSRDPVPPIINVPPLPRTHMIPMEKHYVADDNQQQPRYHQQ